MGRNSIVCGLLALAVLAVYGQVASFEYVGWDDDLYVAERPEVHAGLSREGLDWTTGGGAIGVDFLVSDDLLLGVMGGYARSSTDYDNFGGDNDTDLGWGGIYATYFRDHWYVDGLFGYGRSFYDSKRKVRIGAFDQTATADPEGNTFTLSADGGYNFQLGQGWGIEPNLRLSWVRVDIESFDESGAAPVNLSVDSITEDSLQTELGARVSKIFRSGEKTVWLPELRAAWAHEFLDTDRDISGGFAGTAPNTLRVSGDDPSRNGAILRAGMTVFVNEMVSIYGFYNGEYRNDRIWNGGSLGVRLRF
jgi:outer membrane autotransporter protein